jgi:obg-like ATPase 1
MDAGLPNVGKSSLRGKFLLMANADSFLADLGKAANFPYATINPEEARIPVPDSRFEWLCETYKPVSRVPAFLTCIDIAGLTAVRFLHACFFLIEHSCCCWQ